VATRATERKLAAIMVADVVGFSRLMEYDESVTFARLRQLREEVTHRKVDEHGGRLIKTTGDGFLAEFASATAALRCAIDVQRDVVAREAERSDDTRIRLRIGINVGDIIVDGDDVAGDGVNIAARLEPLAPPDGICISAYVREQIHDDLGIALVDLGEQNLKNIARPIRAFAVTLSDVPRGVGATTVAPKVPAAGNIPSIAVLPFVNLSRDEENEYFADGLAEELQNTLTKIQGVRVASRTSSFFFKGKQVDIPTVAQKLNVASVLEGSVRKVGQRIRITVQLVQAKTDSHLWSHTYDRTLDDIFAVQDDIAHAVVEELRGPLLGKCADAKASATVKAEVQTASAGRADDPEAYRLYLQGRFYAARLTEADIARAVDLFRQALARDPAFALGWAGLAWAQCTQAAERQLPVAEGNEQARECARRALALAPDLDEAHVALGWIKLQYDWDWSGADNEFKRALALVPGSVDAIRGCAYIARHLGRLDEAIALARQAVALDPLSSRALFTLGSCYQWAGYLDEAAASYHATLDITPTAGAAHYALSRIHLLQGRAAEALEEAEREALPYYRLQGVALAQHMLGAEAASNAALAKLIENYGGSSLVEIAQVYAWRGEIDLAFKWFERAYAERDPAMASSACNPLTLSLHGDPRWTALMQKMGLGSAHAVGMIAPMLRT
jgi:adenylate cyclase